MTDEEKEEMISDYIKYKKLSMIPIDPATEKYKSKIQPTGGGCPTCNGYLWVLVGRTPQPGTVGICDGCMTKAADMYKASKKLNFLE